MKSVLIESQLITKYNEDEDSIYLIQYFNNPPGRVFRTKWAAEKRAMPNLQNWIRFFKSSDKNLRSKDFLDIDDTLIGDLHERIKYIYPTDNSVILGQKYLLGDKYFPCFKVLKQGVVFGIKENQKSQAVFWA